MRIIESFDLYCNYQIERIGGLKIKNRFYRDDEGNFQTVKDFEFTIVQILCNVERNALLIDFYQIDDNDEKTESYRCLPFELEKFSARDTLKIVDEIFSTRCTFGAEGKGISERDEVKIKLYLREVLKAYQRITK